MGTHHESSKKSEERAPKRQKVLGRLGSVYEWSHFECRECGNTGETISEALDRCDCGNE